MPDPEILKDSEDEIFETENPEDVEIETETETETVDNPETETETETEFRIDAETWNRTIETLGELSATIATYEARIDELEERFASMNSKVVTFDQLGAKVDEDKDPEQPPRKTFADFYGIEKKTI